MIRSILWIADLILAEVWGSGDQTTFELVKSMSALIRSFLDYLTINCDTENENLKIRGHTSPRRGCNESKEEELPIQEKTTGA